MPYMYVKSNRDRMQSIDYNGNRSGAKRTVRRFMMMYWEGALKANFKQ